jgi:hypothetical protein
MRLAGQPALNRSRHGEFGQHDQSKKKKCRELNISHVLCSFVVSVNRPVVSVNRPFCRAFQAVESTISPGTDCGSRGFVHITSPECRGSSAAGAGDQRVRIIAWMAARKNLRHVLLRHQRCGQRCKAEALIFAVPESGIQRAPG